MSDDKPTDDRAEELRDISTTLAEAAGLLLEVSHRVDLLRHHLELTRKPDHVIGVLRAHVARRRRGR